LHVTKVLLANSGVYERVREKLAIAAAASIKGRVCLTWKCHFSKPAVCRVVWRSL